VRVLRLVLVSAALLIGACATGCGGSSASSGAKERSGNSQKRVTFQLVLACLNKGFGSDNVERDVQPVNPPQLEPLYAVAQQHDVAVTLSNGGTGYVFVLTSASEATAAAKASPVSAHLVVRDNTVTAYVHAPPPASAPPAEQRAPLALIPPPQKEASLVDGCA